ncbi:FitA-like ribbon-helix-helix domain-containing protein [Microbacterium sp. 22242]|uniref:FitA-like ribbon-helix-helix domain-containing protein n=1 Tax=Microbacterium sp. 22242 TaxID=3453896 RepID=UPI003F8407D3
MPNVLIRDLDPAVHSVLSARAEARGQSLQQYLTGELTQLAARPTLSEMLAELEQRPAQHIPREAILKAIRDGRRGR